MDIQIGKKYMYVTSRIANSGANRSFVGKICTVIDNHYGFTPGDFPAYTVLFETGDMYWLYNVELADVDFIMQTIKEIQNIKVH